MLTEREVLKPTAYDYRTTGVLKHKSAIETPILWDTQMVITILGY